VTAPADPPLPSAPDTSGALERRTLWAYALPALGPALLYNLVVVMYLNFATDQLGAAPGVIGAIFGLSKIWDAVSDPMAGYLSDRTRAGLGRRRSWLLGSALPIAAFSLMAWAPPRSLEGTALTVWIAVGIFGFYTAFTAADVPHMALGAELTVADRGGRNRLFAWRQLVRTLGMLGAFGIGTAVVAQPETGREGAFWLASGVGLFSVAMLAWGVWALPPERPDFIARGARNPFRAVMDVAGNPHARLLLFVFFIESMGTGAIGVLVPYVIRYVLELPTAFIPAMLLCYTVAAVAGIPFWVRLARVHEKRRLWLVAMLLSGFGFGLIFWVGPGDWPLMAISGLIAGFGGACGNTLGQALKADVIDVDEYRTGERKEGAYFAAWSFAGKLAAGLMVAVVGFAREATGYVANIEQPQEVRFAMVALMGGMPLAGYAFGALAFARFRLSEAEHTRIRNELDARQTP
jgi:GPH family glycoside/pentoside/hexuronide:cation symporter